MIENILDILETYHNKKQYADEEFILLITDIIVKHYDLNEYIKYISVISDQYGHNNRYSFCQKKIEYNLAKLDDPRYFKILKENYYGFFNLQILKTIIHELIHVYQEQIKDINPSSLAAKILLLGDPNTYIEDISIDTTQLEEQIIRLKRLKYVFYYDRNYRKAPNERMAITYSCVDMEKIIKNDFIINSGYYDEFKNTNDSDLNNILFEAYKLKRYTTNGPSIEYLKKLTHKNRKFVMNDESLYDLTIPVEDRLLYGLLLTKNEYNNPDDIKNELIKKKSFI